MPFTSTYVGGKNFLQEICTKEENQNHPLYVLVDGSRMYRPLTFRENLAARVEDFNTLKDADGKKRTLQERLRLFDRHLDSCTSIVYKARSKLFTIISQDKELILIPEEDFTQSSLPVQYPLHASDLDSTKGRYNHPLTEQQVLNHDAWLMAIEGDQVLLREAAKITFIELKRHEEETGMGFYIQNNSPKNLRRALFVNNLDGNSSASGDSSLNGNGSFLRVAPTPRANKK